MKSLTPCLALLLVFMVGICSAEITGTVVDAETGKPIEGAVVLIQWTKTKGALGMTHHEIYKIFETETDQAIGESGKGHRAGKKADEEPDVSRGGKYLSRSVPLQS